MSEYRCELVKDIGCREFYSKTFKPSDFTDCETADDVREQIQYALEDWGPNDTDYYECFDNDLDVPQEFIDEWRQLIIQEPV